MSHTQPLDPRGPATLEDVLEAVVLLSTLDASQIKALASAGRLREAFPFQPALPANIGPDFVEGEELVEASALPLTSRERAALIQSSMSGYRRASVFLDEGSPKVPLPESFNALVKDIHTLGLAAEQDAESEFDK